MKLITLKPKVIFLTVIVNIIFYILPVRSLLAQDIHFSQFYMSPFTQNPAFTGAVYGMSAQVNYKDQWKSVGTPYKTIAAAYDVSFQRKKKAKAFYAAGLNFFSDKAGDSNMGTTQANLSGACHVYIDRYTKIGGGLQVGYAQRSIDYAALQWGNQFDGQAYNPNLSSRETNGSTAFAYPDVAAGVVYTYNNSAGMRRVVENNDLKANIGMSVFHFSQPKYSFSGNNEKLKVKFVLHADVLLSIPYSNLGFVPGFMLYKQGAPAEVLVGSLIRYKLKSKSKYTRDKSSSAFSLGGYYRAKDAATVAMLLEYSNYAVGMSYDLNTSALKTASTGRGGFELTLRYVGANPFMAQSRSRF
ncbi:MAG: PorP/SprF family type IX secretion system membrane protein [Bacteroidetes bacterium]|nr:PorP/SprF family type IX secretion system membrane protein [Bacteroidota bacterium]